MKLRIRGDSIRLRLTRTEVSAIAAEREVEDCLHFAGGARLSYALLLDPAAREAMATFKEGRLAVTLPSARALAWARGEEVAIQVKEGTSPFILVEKDFACLKPRTFEREDESDMFPNPSLEHGHCQ